MADKRKPNGQFDMGNAGGPGRPRRAVESDYLRALSEACPPDTWQEICQKAVELAKQGDPKAREWLASHLLRDVPTLQTVVAQELAEVDPLELEVARKKQAHLLDMTIVRAMA